MVVATVLLAIPSVAQAWTFGTTIYGGIQFTREASDTADETLFVYTNSNGPTSAQWRAGSYVSTAAGGLFQGATMTSVTVLSQCRQVNFQVTPGYAYLVSNQDGSERAFMNGVRAQPVYLSNYNAFAQVATLPVSVTGTVAAAITSMAADTTMSVSGTLPVSVASIGGTSSDALDLILAGAVVVGGCAVGWAVSPRWHG